MVLVALLLHMTIDWVTGSTGFPFDSHSHAKFFPFIFFQFVVLSIQFPPTFSLCHYHVSILLSINFISVENVVFCLSFRFCMRRKWWAKLNILICCGLCLTLYSPYYSTSKSNLGYALIDLNKKIHLMKTIRYIFLKILLYTFLFFVFCLLYIQMNW